MAVDPTPAREQLERIAAELRGKLDHTVGGYVDGVDDALALVEEALARLPDPVDCLDGWHSTEDHPNNDPCPTCGDRSMITQTPP